MGGTQVKPLALGCRALPDSSIGKEGVDGSSQRALQRRRKSALSRSGNLRRVERAVRMEPFMEMPAQIRFQECREPLIQALDQDDPARGGTPRSGTCAGSDAGRGTRRKPTGAARCAMADPARELDAARRPLARHLSLGAKRVRRRGGSDGSVPARPVRRLLGANRFSDPSLFVRWSKADLRLPRRIRGGRTPGVQRR
jgi:hypothetical protein